MLNTQFVYLLLKLTRTHILYASTTRTPSSTSLAAAMNANSYTSRVLSITVLAMMLRYVTVLNPPTIRLRDDHIVVTIVNLLANNTSSTNTASSRLNSTAALDKIDSRFRRRLVAALGETVFYISAQEDPDGRFVLCVFYVNFVLVVLCFLSNLFGL